VIWLSLVAISFHVSRLDAQDVAGGQEYYGEKCAQCHGVHLQGGNAQSLVDGIWQFGSKNEHIKANIKHGISNLGMPAFAAVLDDRQVESIVTFLRQRESEAGVAPPPIPTHLLSQDYSNIHVDIFAEGLEIPWSIDFVDAKTALITELPGRLRVVEEGRLIADPIRGTPEVVYFSQGGLLDVAIDPDYANNGWIYLAYVHGLNGIPEGEQREPAMTRIVRGRLKKQVWVDQQLVWEAPQDTYRTMRHHYGSRIVFDLDGYLYFSIGDRGAGEHAQDLTKPNGKIHRIHRDGRIPEDNPFVDVEGAIRSIFSYGHRNPQGLATHPETGRLWITEHGPMGGDELNLITKGRNYGWPEISYGLNYDGTIVSAFERKEGMEQPNWYWKPSIAVSGLDFVRSGLFMKWRGHLLVGALKYEEVQLLTIEDDRVLHSETILKNAGRVRDIQTGPDGAIYVVLNTPGAVIRLTPGERPIDSGDP
jgi:glucose/arabinose dehydrogenase